MYAGSAASPTGAIHRTPEFRGRGLLARDRGEEVKAPVLAYKPKKGGETDPEIVPILERGMRYVGEFASAEGGGGEE